MTAAQAPGDAPEPYDTSAVHGTRVTIVDSWMNDRVMHRTAQLLRDDGDTFSAVVTGRGRLRFHRPREQYRIKTP
ncbi:hypothetical protein ACFY05_32965 [Microtetraspora fusca]|uniref:Uncharacterized protein n=1 Tax=Microtetraspora fusca TaxID=1997 RepID=A0ABW6VE65_MICFU